MRFNYIYWSILFLFPFVVSCNRYHEADNEIDKRPIIFPDYADVTFPPNLAPPNFMIKEEGEAFQTEIGCEGLPADILINSGKPVVEIPVKEWKALMDKAAGKNIYFRITIKQNNKWVRYADIKDSISTKPIDPYLVYRLLYPGYELWNEMGIYQRDLTSYTQTPIAENRDFERQCINCHTFNQNSAKTMMMHIRGKQGGTVIYQNNEVKKVNPKPAGFDNGATYAAWHPSGKYIAFAMNEIQQYFHATGKKPIEVTDIEADLMVYDVNTGKAYTDSLIYGNKYLETFPTWSPDGKTLYFCRALARAKGTPIDSVRYDLYSIQFDIENQTFQDLKCLYEASAIQQSVSFPRVSPNGRFLMFTQFDYGNFSIWHPESDLYILDLKTGEVRNMEEVNSDDVESFHTWSSSGNWFVFSSKRLDGLWARPHFASFDPETGRVGKAFLLPQKDPTFYDTFAYTYNLPELIKEPIKNDEELLKAIKQPVAKQNLPTKPSAH